MDWENHLIKHLQWSDSIINREAKEHVAREIAATAKDGDVIGAGSGSTVYLTLFELARRIREEHSVQCGKRIGEEYSGKTHTDCPPLAHSARSLCLSGTHSQM